MTYGEHNICKEKLGKMARRIEIIENKNFIQPPQSQKSRKEMVDEIIKIIDQEVKNVN